MKPVERERSPRFKIEIKSRRKSPGGKRDGRHGRSGKVGVITDMATGEVIHCVIAPTRRELSRRMRKIAHIPPHVRFGEKETIF